MSDRPQMLNLLPPEFHDKSWGAIVTIALAWLGRMMWHIRLVQRGRRKFFSLDLLLELGMAVCIGFVAEGVVSWLGVEGSPATALIIVIAYMGPGGIEALAYRFLRKKFDE